MLQFSGRIGLGMKRKDCGSKSQAVTAWLYKNTVFIKFCHSLNTIRRYTDLRNKEKEKRTTIERAVIIEGSAALVLRSLTLPRLCIAGLILYRTLASCHVLVLHIALFCPHTLVLSGAE